MREPAKDKEVRTQHRWSFQNLLPGVGKSSIAQRKESEHCQLAQERVSSSLTLPKPFGRVQVGERLSVVETRKAWGRVQREKLKPIGAGGAATVFQRESRVTCSLRMELENHRFQLRSSNLSMLRSQAQQEGDGILQNSLLQHGAPLKPHSTGSIDECFSRLTGSSEVKSV